MKELRIVCCNLERVALNAEVSFTYQIRINLSVVEGVITTFHFAN